MGREKITAGKKEAAGVGKVWARPQGRVNAEMPDGSARGATAGGGVRIGDGFCRPRLLHLPQQWHPVHCRPALLHLHALADGPDVEQVEFRVQLQHHSTVSRACQLGRLIVETIPNPL